jgi:hypothetical protein
MHTTPTVLPALGPSDLDLVLGGNAASAGNVIQIQDDINVLAAGADTKAVISKTIEDVQQRYSTKIRQFQIALNL